MYACIYETGGGFCEGVCTPSNAIANFRDPPPTPQYKDRSTIARTPARCGSLAALL
jgi:hypothetical protein